MLHPRKHEMAWLYQGSRSLRLSALFVLLSLPLATTQAAQPAIAETSLIAERRATAEAFLTQKLFMWQKRLKLEDWNITCRMVHPADLKPKTLGNIHWDSDVKRATISVLSPADYKMSFPDALKDMEFTIVHELVHLQLSSLPRNEASRSAEERAVNTLTEALLNLDRHP
jgi:hypothetical protein